jgi:hypothetical protein
MMMMMMTSASASGGDGGVAGSLSEVQRPTGSSTAIAKFCSTDGSSSYGVSSTTIAKFRSTDMVGVLSLRHFRLARWCSLSLGGWPPKNPARRISTCLGPPAARSPLPILVIFRFGATMDLGRSERPSHGVDGADSPDRKPR